MQPPYEPRNSAIRNLLRVGALVFLPIGAIFAAVGLIDFFSAFSGHGFPTKFWCVFVGFPMIGFGTFCFKAGFLRTITGYVAGESAPVVRDTVEYVADGLRPTLRNIAEDIRPTDAHSSPAERMRDLEELKQQGLISEAEFAAKRKEILEDL